jgi:hypothetical protein
MAAPPTPREQHCRKGEDIITTMVNDRDRGMSLDDALHKLPPPLVPPKVEEKDVEFFAQHLKFHNTLVLLIITLYHFPTLDAATATRLFTVGCYFAIVTVQVVKA